MDLGLGQSQLVPLEMKDADFDGVLTWIETLLRVRLPHIETESPSKRSRSPGHEVSRRVYQLFQKDRRSLEEALRDLQLRLPTKESEVDGVLEWLLVRLKSSMKSWQLKNAPYLLTDRSSTLKSECNANAGIRFSSAAPPSPTLSNKRAFVASQRWVTYPDLTSAFGNIDDDVSRPIKTHDKRSASNIFGIPVTSDTATMGPRNLDGTPLKPATSQYDPNTTSGPTSGSRATSANVSFTTTGTRSANTSFWSEPGNPPQSNSSANTVASSVCSDGVDEKETTQPSTFGGSLPALTTSQWERLEGHPTSSYDYGEPFSQAPPTQSHVDNGGSDITSVSSHLHLDHVKQHNEVQDLCLQPLEKTLASKSNTNTEQHDIVGKDDNIESPTIRKWKCRKIVADGLKHTSLPASCDALPFNLKWESLRLIQLGKITCHQLEHDRQDPTSIESLYTLAGLTGLEKVAGFNVDSHDFSLGAKLVLSTINDGSILELRLDRPVHQQQNEFERAYGGNRMLVIELPPTRIPHIGVDEMRQAVEDMFKGEHRDGKLPFLGRQWVEFYTREKKRKNKDIRPGALEFHLFAVRGYDVSEVPIWRFCSDLLVFHENAHQLSGKLYSRLALMASRTDESALFHVDDIDWIEDLKATDEEEDCFNDPELPIDTKFDEADKEEVMTDGCGLISPQGMRQICAALGWSELERLPSVVQGRFAGAKGVWLLTDTEHNPADQRPSKLISIRESQVKIRQDPSNTTFKFLVVRFCSPPKPSILFPGFLPILQNRSGPDADQRLLDFVQAKVRGLTKSLDCALQDPQELRFWMNEQNGIAKTTDRHLGIETTAGFPTSRAERIIALLESGFAPTKNTYLADEVKTAVNVMFTLQRKKFKIPCPQSTMLIGVPDWTGTLRAGEVYVNFSQPFRNHLTNSADWTWAGRDCLVARNPARRISDIQKLRIVPVPELAARGVSDVVVFSTLGRQPEASKLQGGDYDGDTFWVCVEPELVESFQNAPAPRTSPDPAKLFIEKALTTFGDIVSCDPSDDFSARESGLLKWFADNRKKKMQGSLLGTITLFQERLAYQDGVNSPNVNVLNDLLDLIMDQDKQCFIHGNEAWSNLCKARGISRDPRKYPKPWHRKYTSLDCDDSDLDSEEKEFSEHKEASIIDRVYSCVLEPEIKTARDKIKEGLTGCSVKDEQLFDCFNKRMATVRTGSVAHVELQNLLSAVTRIREQGETIRSAFRKGFSDALRKIAECREAYNNIMPSDDSRSDPVIQQWLEPTIPGLQPAWDHIKASALAKRCDYTGVHHIPYLIAGPELCFIKAMASGFSRTLTERSYLHLKPLNKRTLAWTRNTAEVRKTEGETGVADDIFLSAAEEMGWQQIEWIATNGFDDNGLVDAREQVNGGP